MSGWPFLELSKARGGGGSPDPLPPAAAAQNGPPGAEALRGKGDMYGRVVLGVGSAHRQALEHRFGGGHS
jgi:hypothetical protein